MTTTFALLLASTLAAQVPYREATITLTSGEREVPVFTYTPVADGPRPLIIMMHGSGGLAPQGDWMREFAGRFASDGYVVYLPEYRHIPPPGRMRKLEPVVAPSFEACMQIFRDLLAYSEKQPNVDSDRIGLLGYSMGAQLAQRLSYNDPRVAAVALYSGGHPSMVGKRADQFPPTILLAGDADPSAPVKELEQIYAKLQAAKIPSHLHIYPRMGHGWVPARLDDAGARVSAFFAGHLGGTASKARRELLAQRAKEKTEAEAKLAKAGKTAKRTADGEFEGFGGGGGDKATVLDMLAPGIEVDEDLLGWLEQDDEQDSVQTREVLVEPKMPEPPARPPAGKAAKRAPAPAPKDDTEARERAIKQLGEALAVLKDGANAATRTDDGFVIKVTRTELRQLAGLPFVKSIGPPPEAKPEKSAKPRR